MKIAIVPDLHLNKAIYKGVKDRNDPSLPFRSVDFMRSFEYIVDHCINELHPDLFIIPGDVYDHPAPSNRVRGMFSSQLQKLTKAEIPVIILLGNHDVFLQNHALTDIKELGLKHVKVVEHPSIISYKTSKLLLFPYSLDVEQKKVTIKEEFTKFLAKIKEKDDGTPSLFFGHFSVHGAKMNEYVVDDLLTDTDTDTTTTTTEIPASAKRDYINKNPNDIKVSDLDKIGAEYVFLGDFHEFQILNTKKCIAIYGGSIEKSDFSEITQKKGFLWYDSEAEVEGQMGKCRFIEYPNCRPMMELNGTLDVVKKQLDKYNAKDYQDAMVKIVFEGTSDEKLIFSSGEEALKKDLRERLNPINIVTDYKLKNDDQKEAASKLEIAMLEKGHLGAEDIIEVAEEMLSNRIKDPVELAATLDLNRLIFDEVTKG